MAIPQGEMSIFPVISPFIPPDEREHTLLEDYEAGPLAIGDTSEGLRYQTWELSYTPNNFTITPETTGPAVVVWQAPSVTQCTFAFDQNANITLSYMQAGIAKLYWYNTEEGRYVVTTSETGIVSPAVTLDDKRPTQSSKSDVLLWYTRPQGDGTSNLYMRRQRDRYEDEFLMQETVWPYIWKLGMNDSLRVQLVNSTEDQQP